MHPSDYNYPCLHQASTVTMLHFAEGQQGLWQPPVLLDHFLLLGTEAPDGSLCFLKGNCTEIRFSHLQKFFAIVCCARGILLCSSHRGRAPNFVLILKRFHEKPNIFVELNSQHGTTPGTVKYQFND